MPDNPEQYPIIQANPLIEARYKLDLLPQLLLRVLISMIKPDHSSFEKEIYQINIAEFGKLIGRDSGGGKLYRDILQTAKKLLKTSMTIKTNRKGNDILEVTWMIGVFHNPKSSTMEFMFSPLLMPYLLQLNKGFTRYQLTNICQLRSQYSIRLYELLRQYTGLSKRVVSLSELKSIIGADKYKLYNHVRDRVLNPSYIDITTKTDLSYHWRPIKTGRKVTSIEFYDIAIKDVPLEGTPDEKAIREAMQKVDALTGTLGRKLVSPYKNMTGET